MHPILAKRRHLAIYLMAWVPVVVLLMAAMVMTGWGGWFRALVFVFPMAVVFAFLCLSAWYPCRSMPLGGERTAMTLATHATAAGLSAALWVGMAAVFSEAINRSEVFSDPFLLSAEHSGLFFVSGMLLYLLSVAIHYLFAAAESSRVAERRVLQAEVAARDAELLALKTQLNPHFLFNSLNSVASLTVDDPPAARDMCIQLGDYLRGTLKSEGTSLVSLGEELAQVRRFLKVERVRYGDRLTVIEAIDEDCLDKEIPPLLLQPLVENALKHGISELVDGGEIHIGGRLRGDRLRVWVENPCDDAKRLSEGAGVGLANVRQRLAHTFGKEARLSCGRSAIGFRAEVLVPVGGSGSSPDRKGSDNG